MNPSGVSSVFRCGFTEWKWRNSGPVLGSSVRTYAGIWPCWPGTFGGFEPGVFKFHQHVASAPVTCPGHGLQGEGGLLWLSLPVTSGWPPGVPGGPTGTYGFPEQKVTFFSWFSCMYGGLWINFQPPPPRLCLQDVAEDQSGRRESRLTPSQSGCISVAPPALPFPHLVASPVRMMSLTAVNTVSMETPTTALAYISGSSPSILQHHHPPPLSHPTLCVPSLPPSLLTPHLMRTEERWVEGWWGASLLWTGRASWSERKNNSENNHSTGLVCRGGFGGGPLRFRCAQLLILEAERVLTSQTGSPRFFAFLYRHIYEYMYLFLLCCWQRTAAADLLSKSSCLHVFKYNYLNL